MAFKFVTDTPPIKVPSLSIGVTGHRPDKLFSYGSDGYEYGNPVRRRLRAEIQHATETLMQDAVRNRYVTGFRDVYLRRVQWQNGWEVGDKWRTIETLCLHGGAQGTDQDAAAVWYQMGLPYVLVAPFPKQDRIWPVPAQARFAKMAQLAAGILWVSDQEPTDKAEAAKGLLQRNKTLCQMSDELIAVWDGSSGGTAHCVNQWNAVQLGAHLTRLNPEDWR